MIVMIVVIIIIGNNMQFDSHKILWIADYIGFMLLTLLDRKSTRHSEMSTRSQSYAAPWWPSPALPPQPSETGGPGGYHCYKGCPCSLLPPSASLDTSPFPNSPNPPRASPWGHWNLASNLQVEQSDLLYGIGFHLHAGKPVTKQVVENSSVFSNWEE